MRTKQINGKEIGFVEVPEAYQYKLDEILGKVYVCYKNHSTPYFRWTCLDDEPLPSGNWQIIGLASKLSEDEWRGIVESFVFTMSGRLPAPSKDIDRHVNYQSDNPFNDSFATATESAQSLLRSLSLSPTTTLIIVKTI